MFSQNSEKYHSHRFFFFLPELRGFQDFMSFRKEDFKITENFFTEVVYYSCKKVVVHKAQGPGAYG